MLVHNPAKWKSAENGDIPMKNIPLLFICLVAVFGCNLADQSNSSENRVDETRPTPASSATQSLPANFANANSTAAKSDLITKLKKWAGKYPDDVRLLDDPDLTTRLNKLMGKDFDTMKKYWNVESPIEIKRNKLKTTGCEQHNCGANLYVMFVDLENDNINIYHLNDEGSTKTYFEKGKIQLPPDFAAEVETAYK
jgi:hypothetical protein